MIRYKPFGDSGSHTEYSKTHIYYRIYRKYYFLNFFFLNFFFEFLDKKNTKKKNDYRQG